jgi:hypothetical protein
VRNPLQDEGSAFRLVFLTIGAFALIAIGSAISTWAGLGVVAALVAIGGWAVWTGRREQPSRQRLKESEGRPRILVVANETVEGEELLAELRRLVAGRSADVHVVCPALNSKLRHWTSDEDGARVAAQARLERSLERLRAAGLAASGEVGDADPVQAIEDSLRVFGADDIVLATHPPGRSHWLERGVVDAVRDRFVVPVTHVVVDLERNT